jgi:hypothetical protein
MHYKVSKTIFKTNQSFSFLTLFSVQILEGTMFPKHFLNKFYIFDENPSAINSVPEDVQVAYYSFIYNFVRIICPSFREHLGNLMKNPDTSKSFVGSITISDEAYVWWWLWLNYDANQLECEKMIANKDELDKKTLAKKGKKKVNMTAKSTEQSMMINFS